MKKIILALALAGVVSPAFAQDTAGFLRVEGGRSDFTIDGASDNDTSVGVRGGYYFASRVGVEGFYTRYARWSDDFASLKADGYGVGVFGKTNFGDEPFTGFFLSGRVGVAHNTLDARIAGVGSADDSDTNAYIGVGAGYDLSRNLGMSVNYDWQEPKVFGERFKVETWTLAVEYRF